MGVIGFMYLYNVMFVLIFWELGVVGVVLFNDRVYCGFIIDYYYLYCKSVELVLNVKIVNCVLLVIDVMVYVGSDIECFYFFNIEIVRYGDKFIMLDGKILVGLCLDMYSVVLNMYNDCGVMLEDVSKMVSVMLV